MIDIHTHILPALDDGATSIEESIEMLEMASIGETKAVVLTPHVNLYEDNQNLIDELAPKFEAFKNEIKEHGIEIECYLGGEVFCHGDFLKLAEEKKLPTLNGSRFMLIEFDFFSDIEYITSSIKALSSLGYVPIVAHPERYDCIKENNSFSLEIMENGGLLQLNKGSILGDFGASTQKTAFNLMNHNAVQFVASDAHSIIHRTTEMELAFDITCDEIGEERASALFKSNPRAVVENGTLTLIRPIRF